MVLVSSACESCAADAMISFLSRGSEARLLVIDSSHPIPSHSSHSDRYIHAYFLSATELKGNSSRLIHLVLALDAWLSRHSYIAH